ncbi:hypothetical protein LOD99_116 [Oopsacas minuta]|uniref:Chitobiosyldiphosphodolichol beta-mannosyltransferase n=1 Tax=Oopsacas minuta TaxID=111878 RepID=A0AAV7K9B6_9METZ|nr:hypothetical protein LOD99_116 [Oopsacas minuta]
MYYYIAVVVVCIIIYVLFQWSQSGKGIVSVLVLGDMGHSPRMQNHVACLVSMGLKVQFIGYLESDLPEQINTSKLVKTVPLMPLPNSINALPRTTRYFAKFAFQTFQLTFVLLYRVHKSRCLLLQSPPAIPTLLVACLTGLIRGWEVCVDWHNYGYTLMGLQLGDTHGIVKLARLYERAFARLINNNFCVTQAMRDDLLLFWGVQAITLYDKPNPQRFKGKIPPKIAHQLFTTLADKYDIFGSKNRTGTKFTMVENGICKYKDDRPLLLISSTSWTEDEDFGILLEALKLYEIAKMNRSDLPNVVCAITGKGPLRQHYESEISKLKFSSVEIVTLWLEVGDYPKLLATADLGVSLHTSSSGLDLPMKIVDMFGSDLPVLARKFRCIGELVQDSKNGFVFTTSNELCDKLIKLGNGFPKDCKLLSNLQRQIQTDRTTETWQKVWDREARPYFKRKSKPIGLYITRLVIILIGISAGIGLIRLMGLSYLFNALSADI